MRALAPLLALTVWASPVQAGELAQDLSIFQSVCVNQAPGLSQEAIAAASEKVKVAINEIGGGGSVEAVEGRYCTVRVRRSSMLVAPVPEAEAEKLVNRFAARIGSSEVSKKVRKNGNSLSYTVKRGKAQFYLFFEADKSVRRLSITQRGKL